MSGTDGVDQGHHSWRSRGAGAAHPPPVPGPVRRRGGAGFTIFLSLALVAGAGIMALVLLATGAPGALTVGLFLAALPVGPLIASFMWLDRYEPEPHGLILSALGWGALVATAAALLLQTVNQFVFGTPQLLAVAVVAPVTEEAAKGLFVLLLLLSRRHELDGILDGIVYAGLVGIGFAFTENILYYTAAYLGDEDLGPGGLGAATGTFIVRGIFSPFAHPLFTSAIGIGIGIAVVTRSRGVRVLAPLVGYVVAVVAHGVWNASALFADGQFFLLTYLFAMVPAFFLVTGFAVWVRRRERAMLVRALADVADRGYIGHHEIPWLASLTGRRVSRSYARSHGGSTALRAMREYQQQAVELGFLHNRYLRGTAPSDFAERGQVMVNHLVALRPYVQFPQPPAGNVSAGSGWEGGR